MNTKTHETEIAVDSEVPLVRITRDFDALSRTCSARTSTPASSASGWGRAAWRCGSITTTAAPAAPTATSGAPTSSASTAASTRPGGRTRLTSTSLVDSFAARDAFVATGMETGVRESYERLDEVLAGQA